MSIIVREPKDGWGVWWRRGEDFTLKLGKSLPQTPENYILNI